MKKQIQIGIGVAVLLLIIIGLALYKPYYDKKYQFSGLGEIYEARRGNWEAQQQRRMFFEPGKQPPLEETAHLPSYEFRFATNLADRSFMAMELTFRFKNSSGITEIRRKSDRIRHALTIALSPYTRADLENNEGRVLAVTDTILNRYIESEIQHLYLTDYRLSGGGGMD
ncbi:flagellar basal body-associated FliL family protein [Desulfobotulus mexicanus]|uniref:Flagellar basal body-associated FliL family protein n=1 Tax=Desulfobotulus mexicanus TaxID=2586642 RepID=A0A5Q4VEY3_9BACT|nr:flagellar basal body-associated FliL family protein [Desulfobotulus mexicanus]TYT74947.1 flagellar basal body-associated FliL family protein [Desulfobotulus mexicanus]